MTLQRNKSNHKKKFKTKRTKKCGFVPSVKMSAQNLEM